MYKENIKIATLGSLLIIAAISVYYLIFVFYVYATQWMLNFLFDKDYDVNIWVGGLLLGLIYLFIKSLND